MCRNGTVTGERTCDGIIDYPYWDGLLGRSYAEDGSYVNGQEEPEDIVAEYIPPEVMNTTGGIYVSADVYNAVVAERDSLRRKLDAVVACFRDEVPHEA